MTLAEILKSQGLTDEQVATITGEMKQNKIFTSNEEHLDLRYNKLKEKQSESEKLIEELQKAAAGNEAVQAKVAEYEKVIAQKDAEMAQIKVDAAVKVALLGAKALDVDYLTYKLKEKGEIKLDDQGNIKGIDDMLTGLKTQFPTQFESASTEKKINEHKLPDDNQGNKVTKEEFAKMGYKDRVNLFNENPELYNELSN